MQSETPNPKDYSSYDDYLFALELHKNFMEKAEEASKVINESKTDKEIQKGMEELGFTYHEDEYCDGDYCQKHDDCLMVVLDHFTRSFNKDFFADLLPEDKKIITHVMRTDGFDGHCGLPQQWNNKKNFEYKVILWATQLYDAFVFKNILDISFAEIAKQEDYHEFFCSFYLFFYSFLYKQEIKDDWKQEIKKFLGKNKVLSKPLSKQFLTRFEKLITQT